MKTIILTALTLNAFSYLANASDSQFVCRYEVIGICANPGTPKHDVVAMESTLTAADAAQAEATISKTMRTDFGDCFSFANNIRCELVP